MTKGSLQRSLRTILLAQGIMLAGVHMAQAQSVAAAGADSADKGVVGEVIVTATKRAQSAQSVPFSVTALGQADLKDRGAQTIESAINFVPGVSYTSNGTGAGAYTIRGVNTATYVGGTQSPVAVYLDDIAVLDPSSPKITPVSNLFDVSRVEVLEGPQGTLFGSGSIGGAIRIITNKPNLEHYEAETEDTISGTQGGGLNYGLNAMVNLPLVQDKLGLRVVGFYDQQAGWVDNVARNEDHVNHSISEGGRAELKFTPTVDLTIVASALWNSQRPHDSDWSFYDSKQYKWDGLITNADYDRANIYSLSGVYDFHWASLTSITTYNDQFENVQADFSADVEALLGLAIPSPVNDLGASRTFSQELRLASPDTGRFRWLIGGYYSDNTKNTLEPIVVPGSGAFFGSTSDVVSLSTDIEKVQEEAVFGEVSYDILPQLTATVGLRVFRDELSKNQTIGGTLEAPSSAISQDNESSATPKFNLSYRVSPTSLVYAQVAQGYRIGQSNPAAVDPISHQAIPGSSRPDSLWNYELGEKSTFLDGRLLVNAAVYFIDWSNIQLNELTVPSGLNFIGNAGEAHIGGAELEVRVKPVEPLEMGLSLSLNDAHLIRVSPTTAATKGDQLPGSAPETVVLFTEYTHPLPGDVSLFGRVDARWTGLEYSNLENATSLKYGDYWAVNLRGGFKWDRYAVTGFVDNALNGDGKIAALSALGQAVAIRQRPVTVGLTLDAKF
jgi:iron complex outermembrane receptor protein